jgi:hypothetical protein
VLPDSELLICDDTVCCSINTYVLVVNVDPGTIVSRSGSRGSSSCVVGDLGIDNLASGAAYLLQAMCLLSVACI